MATIGSPEWDDTRVASLRQLWDEGHSTAEIGRRLGVSKNAVVGKAHRLDLPARPSPVRQPASETPRSIARRPVPNLVDITPMRSAVCPALATAIGCQPEQPLPVVAAPASVRLGNAHCCWPIGDPGVPTFRFCGSPVVIGKPYCEAHCGLAYRKLRTPREHRAV